MTPFTRRHLVGATAAALLSSFALSDPAPTTTRAVLGGVTQTLLGTAQDFAVLAATTVTNTGFSVLEGDLGVQPGSAVTGFPPGIVNGVQHLADGVALQAQSDALTAYNSLAGLACDTELTGMDLGGLTLTPGVYCFTSSAQLTGTLTLDALGDPDASFVFQIASTLTTATSAVVDVINGGSVCNVFWQIGSSATLGTGTDFVGNIVALTSITAVTGTDVDGRLIALNGAVTLDSNDVGAPPQCLCAAAIVVDLGPGCGNPAIPLMTMTPPVLGQTMSLTITNGEPMSMTKFFVSPCGSTPFFIPGTGCAVYLDVFNLLGGSMGMTDGNGVFTFTWNVPNDPSLTGTCFTVQGLVWSTSGPLLGDSLTNGVMVTFGCI